MRAAASALMALAALGLVGCGGGETVATFSPVTDPAQVFYNLTLDQHAINLSTVSAPTLQLTATPHNALGDLMGGLPAVTFHSSDTTAVQVDSTGMLTARRGATGVTVIAEIVAPGNVRRVDTATVNVIETPAPTLASLSIDPVAPDSAVWSMIVPQPAEIIMELFLGITGLGQRFVPSHPLDASNAEIPGLAIEYNSLDSTIATVDRWTGAVAPVRPGSVRVVARTTAYGVTMTAMATYTVTFPVGLNVMTFRTLSGTPALGPGPTREAGAASEYHIPSYGYIMWFNLIQDPVDIVYDATNPAVMPNLLLPPPSTAGCSDLLDPLACALNTWQPQQFTVPGVYRFTSTRTGITGRIVVGNGGIASAASSGP